MSTRTHESQHSKVRPGQAPRTCFHCGESIVDGVNLSVLIDGSARPVCCPGCQAVAQTILDYGLQGFYKYRTAPSQRPETAAQDVDASLRVYDDDVFQQTFVETRGSRRSASFMLEGVVCPACTWLIESRLARLAGVSDINVSYAGSRAELSWDPVAVRLSEILQAIQTLGYRAWPFHPDTRRTVLEQERKALLRRIGLAGLLGMQVMMISVALYFGDWTGMESGYRRFFYWVCLILTVPVLSYSGGVFFARAWRDLRVLRTGMDVPVALGLLVAFCGSAWSTIRGEGHVYYDSIVMFIFLLLVARYLEFAARGRALRHYDRLLRILPVTVTRLLPGGAGYHEETLPLVRLAPGDRLLVRPGETIGADGTIISGASRIDESLITGESVPVTRSAGAAVIGGSTNIESPIQVRVERAGDDTMLSGILRLADRGRLGRPRITEFTDRVASVFVLAVIILAAGIGLYWWHVRPEMWLPVTVAVLVITCPCALSLATPIALTCARSAFMRQGLAVAGANALEILYRSSRVVFDKTGTLTRGRPVLLELHCLSAADRDHCLHIAAALEQQSEHPIAAAIRAALGRAPALEFDHVHNYPGRGIAGTLRGRRYFLGTAAYVGEQVSYPVDAGSGISAGASSVLLADEQEVLCVMHFGDELRVGARQLLDTLRRLGKQTMLLSGDSADAVRQVAHDLGITDYRARLLPDQKREIVDALIEAGELVVFVGDGVNDAPVLAVAHASVAMGQGVDIAKLNADMILLNDNLDTLARAFVHARATSRVIRQNLGWALGYNLLALPAAAAGLVAPWQAAIGMSLSSLLVVANSIRLGRM